jgi:hypothetical protein
MGTFTHHRASALVAFSLAVVCSSGAFAGTKSQAQLRFEQERAACMNGSSNQDRATCLREANAALQEARRGGLSAEDLARNSVARCDALPTADRADCVKRIESGASTGTARDGGILREHTQPAVSK